MTFDAILVGGGLQTAVVALAILDKDPTARLLIVERGAALGGNHTWSFQPSALSPAMRRLVAPLVAHRWNGYQVAFPGYRRTFPVPYASITSRSLDSLLTRRLLVAPRAKLWLGQCVTEVGANEVRLESGERIRALHVIDARGPSIDGATEVGYQKFVGVEVELEEPVFRGPPCIMDAAVPQRDGFRFLYTLPFSKDRWLVEDTYYSDTPDLDAPARIRDAVRYVESQGGAVQSILRVERGVLPLPFSPAPPVDNPLRVGGYRGGWMHGTTGYSLPAAARFAQAWANAWPHEPNGEERLRLLQWRREQTHFFILLNRLLFKAYTPEDRWRSLERFHRLPLDTVARFYAMRTTPADRARILLGRPPRGIQWTKAFAELAAASGVWT